VTVGAEPSLDAVREGTMTRIGDAMSADAATAPSGHCSIRENRGSNRRLRLFPHRTSSPRPPRPVEPGQLALRVPVAVIGEREMAALFDAAPDGWRAFFERYPGASGVTELSRATALPDGAALVYVARQCGEQCAGVFRVLLTRDGHGRWAARSVEPVRQHEIGNGK
jgi:hypothetical protein